MTLWNFRRGEKKVKKAEILSTRLFELVNTSSFELRAFLLLFFIILLLYIYIYIYIFGCAGSSSLHRLLSSCSCSSLPRMGVSGPCRLLLQGTGSRHLSSVVAAHGLQSTGILVAQGLSCSTAAGIFPDQGSSPCLLQVDSLPLSHLGRPGW